MYVWATSGILSTHLYERVFAFLQHDRLGQSDLKLHVLDLLPVQTQAAVLDETARFAVRGRQP